MTTRLKNIVHFTEIAPNVPSSLPHGLINSFGRKLTPDLLIPSLADAVVTADDTNITVTVNATQIEVYAEAWHTIERAFADTSVESLDPQPFVVSGAGSTPGYNLFVFRPGATAGGNVYTDWAALHAAASAVQGHRVIQFDDSLVTPCQIPAGSWDMRDIEWQGARPSTGGNVVVQIGDNVDGANDATFPNLLWIGNDLQINNRNKVTSPIVVAALTTDFSQTFEFGFGPSGAYFTADTGAANAPFMDASACEHTFVRMQGLSQGAGKFIELGAGATQALILVLLDNARIYADQIHGTNAGQIITVFYFGTSAVFSAQPNFAGTIARGGPTTSGAGGYLRTWLAPFGTQPPATAPIAVASGSPIALGTASLGMNTTLRLDTTAGNIAQPLPKIKAAAPAAGTSPVSATGVTAGVLLSEGMVVIVKNEKGANAVNVSPAAGDTIEGGAGPLAVPAGGARILQSDGVSNWFVIGGYL